MSAAGSDQRQGGREPSGQAETGGSGRRTLQEDLAALRRRQESSDAALEEVVVSSLTRYNRFRVFIERCLRAGDRLETSHIVREAAILLDTPRLVRAETGLAIFCLAQCRWNYGSREAAEMPSKQCVSA